MIIAMFALLKSVRCCKNVAALARELIEFEQLVQEEIEDLRPPVGTLLDILPTEEPIGGLYYPTDGTMGSTYWYRLATGHVRQRSADQGHADVSIGQSGEEARDFLLDLAGLSEPRARLVHLVDAALSGLSAFGFDECQKRVKADLAAIFGSGKDALPGAKELEQAMDAKSDELKASTGSSHNATGIAVRNHEPGQGEGFECTALFDIWEQLGRPPLVTGEDGNQYFQMNSGVNPTGPTTTIVVAECASTVVYCRSYDPVSGESVFNPHERPAAFDVCTNP